MMKRRGPIGWFLAVVVMAGVACNPGSGPSEEVLAQLPESISFNYHIRPILSDRCFSCHGPDEAARKGELRLDGPGFAFARRESGRRAIQAGSPTKSEVYHRIFSDDPEVVMPPPESNLNLSDYEKALIARWIADGAVYEPHWAFTPVRKPVAPQVKHPETAVNEIDHFILAGLQAEGMSLSPQAGKERQIRRLSFDLTGLPPSLEAIDEFLGDQSEDAYERLVNRLLDSDAYAERMAQDWLDLARYADSQGLHSDGWRSMYPWRDWVIRAFRENMPFDQFLTLQLAGDLLLEPTRDQLVATGFNRNHKTTAEGGVVDEEYRAEYVHDRVATTATTFLGLTMECARCHDHKYDPVSQKEYYQFYAFFNQVDEVGLTGDDGNSGPNLLLPSPATELRLKEIGKTIREKEMDLELAEKELAEKKTFIAGLDAASLSRLNRPEVYLPFDRIAEEKLDGHPESSYSGEVEIVDDERGKVLELNAEYEFINIKEKGLFEQYQPFSGGIWVRPEGRAASQTIVGNSGQKGTFWRGWDLVLDSLNRLSMRLIHALPQDLVVVRTEKSIPVEAWSHVAFTYDGSGRAAGIQLFINGVREEKVVLQDRLQRSIYPIAFSKDRTDRPLRLGKSYRGFTGEYGIYTGKMDEFYLYGREMSPLEVRVLAGKASLDTMVNKYRQTEDPTIGKALANMWWKNHLPATAGELIQLRKQRQELLDTLPEVMVMKDVEIPRPTYVLHRGNYNEPTTPVQPGTPQKILPFSDTLEANRLGLSRWLLHPDHPLTSRVLANRLWQQFFGQGLVDTPHDFGLQGSLPTHPELLDWLAATLIENHWDIQDLQKRIVLSATYRQSSRVAPALREKDPSNRLLSRGPSYRLPAEMIRDNALFAAGILNRRIGGPSVKPVQPPGLWAEKTSSTHILRKYVPDEGDAQYRRSLYTFIRRTSPHPAMTAFDAPNRSVCTAQRSRTNTPMQALVLLNDPEFVEVSRCLAQKVLQEESSPEAQIITAFRRLAGHHPKSIELTSLKELFAEERERFLTDPDAAKAYISIGQSPVALPLAAPDLAAMTVVVNTIMNFDEAYMKR